MPPNTLLRVALVLTATGILGATSLRHSIEATPPDIPFALGYLFYLALILFATPVHPPRFAVALGFALAALTYVAATVAIGGNVLAMAAYALVALGACLATPVAVRPLGLAAFALWTPALRIYGGDSVALSPILALASGIALIAVWAALLDRRPLAEGERLRRVGFGLLALASVAIVAERQLVVAAAGLAPDEVMVLIASVVVPALGYIRARASMRDTLATALALAVLFCTALALLGGKGYHVDSVTVPHRAAELMLGGRNPYTSFDLPEALARFRVEPELVTHYEDGSVVRDLNYPALSFLVVVPFVAAGGGDIRFVYLAEIAVLVLVLMRFVRAPWLPFVVACVVGNTIILRQSILAGVDPTWAILLVGAWLAIRFRLASSILMGLAMAARQPAWFVAPFYLAAIWKRDGQVEAARRAALVAVAALVPNIPFLIDAPAAFVAGVTGPIVGALPPEGVGLIRFALSGPLPLFPRAVYGAISLAALGALLFAMWRYWRSIGIGAVVFPFVPLYLAWRSLQNYFGFVPLLALVADDELRVGTSDDAEPSVASTRAPSAVPVRST